jgi:hypothetical protein
MLCDKKWLALVIIGLFSTTAVATPAYAVTDLAKVVLDSMKYKAEEKAREKANSPPPPPRPQNTPEPRKSDEEKRYRAEVKFDVRKRPY